MAVRREHQRLFEARFPTLPEVDIRHTWAGFVCVAQNQAPGFGRVAPNVYAAVCQNSLGVTMGTIAGVNAADLALGMDSPLLADMHALGQPNRLPPRPFLDIGVRALNTHPQKTVKKGVGDRNLNVTFGGVTFKPGEYLYADEDGVLVSEKPLT